MALHHRRLPHIYPPDAPLFLTWHLHGSVPATLRIPGGPLSSGQAFVWLDRQLDTLTCLRGSWWVPSTKDLLIEPAIAPERLMGSRLLGRTGGPFCQKESYDHCVRNTDESHKIKTYIED